MKYVSTRGTAPVLEFGDVLLTGLARDGGLYLPESWPVITPDDVARFADLRDLDAVRHVGSVIRVLGAESEASR